VDVMTDGGPFMTVVAGLGGLGLLVALLLTGLGLSRKRIWLSVWLLIPLLGALTGAFGAWSGTGAGLDTLSTTPSDQLAIMAHTAYAHALLPDWFGRWLGAGVLVLSAWGAGLGAALRGDEDTQATWFSAFLALGTTVVFSVGAAVYAWHHQLGQPAFILAGLLLLGGIGVSIGATRRHVYDHAFRVAGMRFASGMLLVFAMSWAGRAVVLGARIDLAKELSITAGSAYAQVLEVGVAQGAHLAYLGWIALIGAWLIATAGFFAELGDVIQKITVLDMTGVVFLLVGGTGVRMVEHSATDRLLQVSNLGPLGEYVDSLNYDLPASVMFDETGAVRDARVAESGFGDVVLIEEDTDGNVTITRTHTWGGRGWDYDPKPLADVELDTSKSVLIVANGDTLASELFPVLKKAGGKALLLGRGDSISEEPSPELRAREGIVLPVSLEDMPDFANEIWFDGDKARVFDGPVEFYGAGFDARKPYQRIVAAFAAPELAEGVEPPPARTGLYLLVGERTRVRGVFDSCIPALTELKDGAFVGNGRTCHVGQITVPEDAELLPHEIVIAKAMETFEMPKPENLRATYKVPRELDEKAVTLLLDRQLGAFSYCGTLAEGDAPLTGRVVYDVAINGRGIVDSVITGDRHEVESEPVLECVRRRIRAEVYPAYEVVDPEKLATIELTLTYR